MPGRWEPARAAGVRGWRGPGGVGEGGGRARVGRRVGLWRAAAGRRWGTAAEWTVVPGRQAVPLPDGVSMELGASLGVPAMTAHRCLFADGPVTGQTVLVAGGAGAVGHFPIPLARWGGAQGIATVSGPEKAELARQAGAGPAGKLPRPGAAAGGLPEQPSQRHPLSDIVSANEACEAGPVGKVLVIPA